MTPPGALDEDGEPRRMHAICLDCADDPTVFCFQTLRDFDDAVEDHIAAAHADRETVSVRVERGIDMSLYGWEVAARA